MPTYDYRCEACQHRFEQFQSITAKRLRKCPECGRLKLKRLIGTGAGIIFKGSGFYETDYRSESYKKAEKAEKEKASPAKDTKNTKPDKKDATPPPATSKAKKDAAGTSTPKKPATSKAKKSG